MITGMDIVRVARGWVGTPYQHQGRTKGYASDCIGLIYGVADELGLVPEGFVIKPYGRMPNPIELLSHVHEGCDELPKPYIDHLQFGDVVVMAFVQQPVHMGIIANHPHRPFSLIHAYSASGKVVEHGLDEEWLRKIRRAYRIKGVVSVG